MRPPVVTALVKRRKGAVAVELDGAPWRVLPTDVVHAAALAVGVELDRHRARLIGRARRHGAVMEQALGALSARDLPAAGVDAVLERRGVRRGHRRRTVARLEQLGVVSDARYAENRARALAARDYGDAAIAHDLARAGIELSLVADVLTVLEPESERVARLVESRGASRRLVRLLMAKGFAEESLEAIVAAMAEGEIR